MPEKQSVSTVVMVVGMLKTLAALARATTLFFSVWRSIDCTPKAICGCWSMKMIWLFWGVRTSRYLDMVTLSFTDAAGTKFGAGMPRGPCALSRKLMPAASTRTISLSSRAVTRMTSSSLIDRHAVARIELLAVERRRAARDLHPGDATGLQLVRHGIALTQHVA